VEFDPEAIRGLILRLPVVLFALTVHEFMHGWVAHKCGDDTALHAGRLTLNPLAHLDPIGTICLMVGPIGWAKPVPVNPANFAYETRRRDEILVSGAGVAANLAMGVTAAVAMRFLAGPLAGMDRLGLALWQVLIFFSMINLFLGLFNLLPFPPLDGSHILKNLLPLNAAIRYASLARYGPFVLLAFVVGNMFLADAIGFSLLGYPALKALELLSGLDLFPA